MRQLLKNWFVPAPDSLVARDLRRARSPWLNAVHLLWSVWVFIIPMFDGFTWGWALGTLLSYPTFLFLYAKCCTASQQVAYRYALALVMLTFVTLPWYPSGLTYFVYGCVMLCTCRMSLRSYLLALAGLNAICLVEVWLLKYPWQAVVWMPVTTVIVGLVVNAERHADQKELELSLSQDEVRRLAALAERERIGRDLHDLLGHTLSLITLKLELSRKLFDRDSEAARREMEEAEKVARHALSEVRSAVSGIRATDLAAELAAARLMLGASAVELESGELPPSLPGEVERALSLVLREAITNIARHAQARKARVSVVVVANVLQMGIEDDGRGGIDSHGNGLSGMHERVRALGGSLAVDSPRGKGTRLSIRVPLRARLTLVGDGAEAHGQGDGWPEQERHAS
ncbi:sensor histidine kinase [Dyella sp. ASV21]|uniref:sensor histidine kinase n=1 Tax=Dyella sp. ASV21 TaxID=2795114 RepID=UPI0031B801D0